MLSVLKDLSISPEEMIAELKKLPGLAGIYETKVRHYSVEVHTKIAINQFDLYFSSLNLPIPKNVFRLLLAIHDLGKPQADHEGKMENQYRHTVRLIDQIGNQLPFPKEAIDLCLAIIDGDPIGLFMQGKIELRTAKTEIQEMASHTAISLADFFKTQTIYYQCDIAAYTADAGGIKYLERLFHYKDGQKSINSAKGILQFSPIFELKYLQLENAIV